MPRPTGFLDKLLQRLEKLDPASLQAQFISLARDRGFLETVFQSIQEGILVVSPDGLLQYANRAAETFLGFESGRLRNRSITRLLPDIEWDRLFRRDEDEWARLFTSEIEITFPTPRILSFYAVPLATADTAASSEILVLLRDVTRERAQEASLVESERLQAVRFLAASVAHEIGNPLNALGIHLQILEREIRHLDDPPRQSLQDLLTVARDEVARLDLILSQFLGALRPAAPTLKRADLSQVLQETLLIMRSEIENRRMEVSLTHPDTIPEVCIDRSQMKQVFFNIIRNALQAMPDGGRLSLEFSSDERNLIVSVKDSGSGISPDQFRRMFEAFHTTREQGHGLGLMIVQRIIQDHGGQIEVSSKPGSGTVFRIVLPLADRRIRLLPH